MVEQLLNKYRKNIVMLDGILQWALNPTPKKAGFGFEINYDYIMKNLKITHELSISEVEKVIKELKEGISEVVKKEGEIYDIRKKIITEINKSHYRIFFKFIKRRINRASEEVINFLNIYKNHPVGYDNLQAQFNAIYGSDVDESKIIHAGILKVLYWISSGNIDNSSSSPELIPFLDKIIEGLKLKWNPDKVNVKKYVKNLKDNNKNDVVHFLVGLMERDEIYIRYFNKSNGTLFSNLRQKGYIGIYDTPHQSYKDRLSTVCVSFLIKDELFNAIEILVEEKNEEQTKKIIRLLEYEIENKKEASDKEIIRIAGIGIDELDEFKELISELPQESFDGNEEIDKMATETINKFDNPTLYDLLTSLKFDIKTARKVGKYLVEKRMIENLSRIEGSTPSETSSISRPVEIYCEECRTVLTDRENPKFCPLCGSSNLSEKTI